MDLKFNKQNIKSIDNWYFKKVKETMDLCDHIENLSLKNNDLKKNKFLINAFKNQQLNDINEKYVERIEKYNKKKKNINENINIKKRNEELEYIIKNKIYLESIGEDKDKINKYCNDQYNFINNKYLSVIDFID